jgi:cell division protein ZapA
VSEAPQKTVVTVTIAGEQYTIRADATPEYTQRCAAYVDETIGEILVQGSLIQPHKAAILGALAITDQLFRAREEIEGMRAEMARLASGLAADIEARLASPDLAARS